MAKTRAQRKAERRAREAEEQKRSDGYETPVEAQRETQTGVSGDVAEVEAVEMGIAAGAPESQLETPDAPKPRSARKAEARAQKEAEKRKRAEQKRRESEQLSKKQKQAKAERQRAGFIGFLISCWQELKKVQWPDRETLIQATAVTILFVAVAAAYLGALDAAFSWLIKQIL
ncbi:MAG: preprotein translocase subunit SecE [Actinobacteria bacterium]|nr:MAG: preprotein translocase subunit SecE [Actinomycetota bacterium]